MRIIIYKNKKKMMKKKIYKKGVDKLKENNKGTVMEID